MGFELAAVDAVRWGSTGGTWSVSLHDQWARSTEYEWRGINGVCPGACVEQGAGVGQLWRCMWRELKIRVRATSG
jgi:hypothetical protein